MVCALGTVGASPLLCLIVSSPSTVRLILLRPFGRWRLLTRQRALIASLRQLMAMDATNNADVSGPSRQNCNINNAAISRRHSLRQRQAGLRASAVNITDIRVSYTLLNKRSALAALAHSAHRRLDTAPSYYTHYLPHRRARTCTRTRLPSPHSRASTLPTLIPFWVRTPSKCTA